VREVGLMRTDLAAPIASRASWVGRLLPPGPRWECLETPFSAYGSEGPHGSQRLGNAQPSHARAGHAGRIQSRPVAGHAEIRMVTIRQHVAFHDERAHCENTRETLTISLDAFAFEHLHL
jgi:hypothetical protein